MDDFQQNILRSIYIRGLSFQSVSMLCLISGVSFSCLVPREQGCGGREVASSTCRPSASLPGSRAPTTKGDATAAAPSDNRAVRQAGRGQPKPQSNLFHLVFKIKGLGLTLRWSPYTIALFDLNWRGVLCHCSNVLIRKTGWCLHLHHWLMEKPDGKLTLTGVLIIDCQNYKVDVSKVCLISRLCNIEKKEKKNEYSTSYTLF